MRCLTACCAVMLCGVAAADEYDDTWREKTVVMAAQKSGVVYAMDASDTGAEIDTIRVRLNAEGEIVYLTTETAQRKVLWTLDGRSSSVGIKSVSDNKYMVVNGKSTPKLEKGTTSSSSYPWKYNTSYKTFTYKHSSPSNEYGVLMYPYAFKLEVTSLRSTYPLAKPYFLADHTWRTLGASDFGTICLPKAVRADEVAGATFYEIAAKVVDGGGAFQGIVLREVTGGLEAGTPYIFKRAGGATYIVAAMNGDAVEVAGSHNGLVGTLTGSEEDGGFPVPADKYILQGDHLWLTTLAEDGESQSRLLAGRAYIDPDLIETTVTDDSEVKGAVVLGLDIPYDGVDNIRREPAGDRLFDLQGRKVLRPHSGSIHLIRGHKVIIK